MGNVNVDDIQVGDLVRDDDSGEIDLGIVTKLEGSRVYAIWSCFKNDTHPSCVDVSRLTGHWKVINFEEETKVDELKVYTGKETIEALLEGKTLQTTNQYKGKYKLEDDKLMYSEDGSKWSNSYANFNVMSQTEFTEVATPQVGDWVKVTDKSYPTVNIGKITRLTEGKMWAYWDSKTYEHWNSIDQEYCTWEILSPEQIAEYKREQVFAKVGRKPNEFRENDIVFLENTGTICMVTTKSNFNGNVGVKEINKPQKWNASVKQLEPIAFAENLVSLS